ncbi:uncharacterized protein BXZ73DRAFT_108247 [Epithele typhae]|uniref:uncharacterized protein n=1 Tax=Epithele typhae TaxID=378194 RepID=UPI002007C797|nr:uncharacterized protein BXZ73DRAFT_108247 [Epithele typhae]KAH9911088.1 hypothetical protein BXZ73DRAFT_108247 [Epithele typhae]
MAHGSVRRWSPGLYDWRKGFATTAIEAVQDEIDRRLCDTVNVSPKDRTPNGIRRWLDEATKIGGEAMWGQPNTENHGIYARLQLQSKFVLKVLGFHLDSIEGSVVKHPGFPVGALAMAAAAVERAFEHFINRKSKKENPPPFSARLNRDLTVKWRNTAVADLLKHPRRLEELMECAEGYMANHKPSARDYTNLGASRMYRREPMSSSDPARPEE